MRPLDAAEKSRLLDLISLYFPAALRGGNGEVQAALFAHMGPKRRLYLLLQEKQTPVFCEAAVDAGEEGLSLTLGQHIYHTAAKIPDFDEVRLLIADPELCHAAGYVLTQRQQTRQDRQGTGGCPIVYS